MIYDSIIVTGSAQVSGSLSVTGGITGSLQGTASYAISASYATTASFVANASSFPFTGSAIITGSLVITGSTTSTGGFTGSLFGTAATASYIQALSGYTTASRTLTINGESYDLTADRSWTVPLSGSVRTIQKFTATSNQTTFNISGGYVAGLVDVYVNGVKLDNNGDFTATNGTTVVLTVGAMLNDIVEVYNYISAFTANNTLRVVTPFTATAAQTTFSASYTPGFIDVFYNGSKLAASEYTASNGTSIVLGTAAQLNDIIEVTAYSYTVGAFTGIGGSGTANYIAKFTSGSTIATSSIYDSGSNVGINTINPIYTLDVSGSARFTNTATITGSLNVSGSNTLIGTKTITGSVFISGSKTIIGNNIITGSLNVSGSSTIIGATTISGSLTVSGSITSNGTLTAQTLVVQTITSSVLYSSGSNIFGNSVSNTQLMTGSVSITGSLTLNNIAIPTSASLASTYLPLSGGTLTGALGGTSASFSSNVIVGGGTTSTSKLTVLATTGVAAPGSPTIGIYDTGNPTYGFDFDLEGVATGDLYLSRVVAGTRTAALQIARASGAATFSSSVKSNSNIDVWKNGSNSFAVGSYFTLLNNTGYDGMLWQLNASNNIDYWGITSNTATASPVITFTRAGAATFSGSVTIQNAAELRVYRSDNTRYGAFYTDGVAVHIAASTDPLRLSSPERHEFYTSGSERMRITSDGDVLIGNTSISTANTAMFLQKSGVMTNVYAYSSGTIALVEFYKQGAGQIGGITYNGTNTLFNGTSDYRLKEDLKEHNGLEIISKLKTYDFKWKSNGVRDYGMMAHELQEILPNYVSGEKDAVDEQGNIKAQGVDYSKIVPILIKSVQELSAKNDALQTRITQLENK